MKVRVITAIIGIIAVLGLVYLGGWFLTGAIFLVSLLALLEYDKMLKHFGVHIYLKATAIATGIRFLFAESLSGCDFSCLCTASLPDSGH